MKNLMLTVLLILASNSAHAIKFETKVLSNPLKLNLVTIEGANNYFHLRDTQGKVRMTIVPEHQGYYFYNSNGVYTGGRMYIEEYAKLISYASFVNKSCSMDLEIERETYIIQKAKLNCDPLASVEVEENKG